VRGAPQTKQALPESTRKVKRAAGGGAVCLASGADLVPEQPGEQGVKPERVPRALDRYCGRCLQVHVELLHGVAVMAQAVPPQLPCRRVQHCHAVVSRMQVHLKSIVITWSSSPSHGVGPTTVSPCGRWMLAIKRGRHTVDTPCRQPSYSCVMRTVTTPPSSKKILAHLPLESGRSPGFAKTRGRHRCALAPPKEGYSQTISVEVANTCHRPTRKELVTVAASRPRPAKSVS
jgi:hypothetical protein